MLEKIHTAHDIRKFNNDELNALAGEIREFLIENVSKTGGHLSAIHTKSYGILTSLHRCPVMPRVVVPSAATARSTVKSRPML